MTTSVYPRCRPPSSSGLPVEVDHALGAGPALKEVMSRASTRSRGPLSSPSVPLGHPSPKGPRRHALWPLVFLVVLASWQTPTQGDDYVDAPWYRVFGAFYVDISLYGVVAFVPLCLLALLLEGGATSSFASSFSCDSALSAPGLKAQRRVAFEDPQGPAGSCGWHRTSGGPGRIGKTSPTPS